MAEKLPASVTQTEAGMLTKDEITILAGVGVRMCSDMIDAAAAADLFAAMGMEDSNPARRVTSRTADVWTAIANEYMAAFDELEANGTL